MTAHDVSALRLATAALLIWGSTAARAQPYLIEQPPNGSSSSFSDLACGQCGNISIVFAEDFVLTSTATILEIHLWGGYFMDQEFPDAFTVELYVDSAGLPAGLPLVSESGLTPVSEVDTGALLGGGPEHRRLFVLRLSAPISLAAGTYWLAIANDSSGSSGDFLWELGDLDSMSGRSGYAFRIQSDNWLGAAPNDHALAVPVVLFAGGFESGDLTGWSASVP